MPPRVDVLERLDRVLGLLVELQKQVTALAERTARIEDSVKHEGAGREWYLVQEEATACAMENISEVYK
jgi:hypothetical protein